MVLLTLVLPSLTTAQDRLVRITNPTIDAFLRGYAAETAVLVTTKPIRDSAAALYADVQRREAEEGLRRYWCRDSLETGPELKALRRNVDPGSPRWNMLRDSMHKARCRAKRSTSRRTHISLMIDRAALEERNAPPKVAGLSVGEYAMLRERIIGWLRGIAEPENSDRMLTSSERSVLEARRRELAEVLKAES